MPDSPAGIRLVNGVVREKEGEEGSAPLRALSFSDKGNGERLVRMFGADLRYVYDWNKHGWLVWTGRRWKQDNTGEIERKAKVVVESIIEEYAMDPEGLKSWAGKSQSDKQIQAMIRLARSEKGISVTPDELDADTMLFNVLNGTIDLRTGEHYPARREDLITRCAPVDFDQHCECPEWIKFLDRILGGSLEMRDFLKRAVGYSLTGDISERCMFLLYGTGRNGKTTFLETLRSLFGKYGQRVRTETLLAKKNDNGSSEDIAQLKGARLVTASETEEGRRLSEALIKDLTGGDTQRARRLYENSFEFDPTFKLWMATNYKPAIRGTDEGIWDRIRMVEFNHRITDEELDTELRDKLKAELPGILNWGLEGLAEWRREGLGAPTQVIEATQRYREEQDLIGQFIKECCILSPAARVPKAQLYSAYQEWAKEANEFVIKKRHFGQHLADRDGIDPDPKPREASARVWGGIGLRSMPGAGNAPSDAKARAESDAAAEGNPLFEV